MDIKFYETLCVAEQHILQKLNAIRDLKAIEEEKYPNIKGILLDNLQSKRFFPKLRKEEAKRLQSIVKELKLKNKQ